MSNLRVNDFWRPRQTYYASERFKSLLLKDDKFYLCNETHTSDETFDETKFTLVAGGSGSGGGTYRGTIDLTPTYELQPASINVLSGGSITSTQGGLSVITTGQLPSVILGSNTAYAFTASSTPLYWDKNSTGLLSMSFVWPEIPPTEIGYFGFLMSDENISPFDVLLRIFGQGAGDMQALGALNLYSGGTIQISVVSTVDGLNPAVPSMITMPIGGSLCNITFNPSTGDTYLYSDTGNYNQHLGVLPLGTLADNIGLSITLLYVTMTDTTEIPNFKIGFTTPLEGCSPFQLSAIQPIVLPPQAVDGDYLLASVGGTFGTKNILTDSYFILINNKTDCIVLQEPSGTPLTESAVNALILAAIQTGQPVEQVVQGYIATALANYNDKTGINIVGDWNAQSTNRTLSNFSPVSGITGTVSGNVLSLVSPLPSTNIFSGRSYMFNIQDNNILSTNRNIWSFDFLLPDITALDAALYFEVCPTTNTFYSENFGSTNYARITYQDSTWSGAGGSQENVALTVGDRIRVRLDPILPKINVYRLANPNDPYSQEILIFSDTFVGMFPLGNMKADISFASYTSTPNLYSFIMYGNRRFVTLPVNAVDKETYHITNADAYSYFDGKLLLNDDFLTFYSNTTKGLVSRLYTDADIKNIADGLPVGVMREPSSAPINEGGTVTIGISDNLTPSYIVFTNLNLVVVGSNTVNSFELQLTTSGGISTVGFKDGLIITVNIDTIGGFGVTSFNTTGFYGEPINTTTILPSCITIMSYHVTYMFDGTLKWTLDSKSVI